MPYQSKDVRCERCGKIVKARGLPAHMLLAHQIVVERKTPVRLKTTITVNVTVNNPGSNVIRNNNSNPSQSLDHKLKNLTNSGPKRKSAGKPGSGEAAKSKKPTAVDNKIPEPLKPAWFSFVEAEAKNYKPTFGDWMKYYRRDLERAKKDWERIAELEENYAWPCLINPEKYRALKRVLFEPVI